MSVAPNAIDQTNAIERQTQDSSARNEVWDQQKIEMLGRQRPEAFSNWFVESAFVFALVGSILMSEYTISGFNIALPTVARELNIPDSARTWPAAVPNLTTAVLLLPFARLSEKHGGRYIFLAGHAWLMTWSLICGFSQNPTMLIACRAMQGLGSSAFLPSSLAIMGRIYRPGPRKNLVFSMFGAFACIGFYAGIFFGGLSAQVLGWRWYFWIGSILGLAMIAAGFFAIPHNLGDKDTSIRMDWLGVCTIVPGLALVFFAFTDGGHAPNGWRTPYVYVTLVIGVLFLAAAVYVEGWVAAQPLLPADVFSAKYMKRLILALFFIYGTFGLFLFYSSYYIESVLLVEPLLTAAWFTPLCLGGMVLALIGGVVLHLLSGQMLLIVSGVGSLASVLLFALIPDDGRSNTFLYWAFIFPSMILGTIGVDIAFNVTNVFITTSLPARHQAIGGAMINSLLYLGIAFWLGVGELAVSVTIDMRGRENVSPRAQYQIGFWTGVGLSATALCIFATTRLQSAKADFTADEKARMKQEQDALSTPVDPGLR
ncbi:MFS transporter-like protein 80 [Elsinoe australis]|uniref:MFS transporter-like protein 80 n=1 Tax=Elsinoe australis TaxID=40998 RepID=A0A4U7AWT1_9PEZI|nr:MFS transporter-like protein 80 [Elsinoe australis]